MKNKLLKNFYCVKIEYSGNIFVGWGGGRVGICSGGRKARMGAGNKVPVSGYNTAPPSP